MDSVISPRMTASSHTISNGTHLILQLVKQTQVKYGTSTILLITFNMISAGIIVGLVLYDAWCLAKRSYSPKTERMVKLLQMVHPAEVVPLSISMAILGQGVVFLAVQAVGVGNITAQNCRDVGQLVFPALWVVGFALLVFAIETVYRGLQKNRFASRGRWNITICWAAVAVMLLLTWIPTVVRQAQDGKCAFDLLVLYAVRWADVAFGITLGLIISYLALGTILVVQLLRTTKLDRAERIAASRMVYYLGLAVILFSFIIPLWGQLTFSQHPSVTFMMATVGLNIFGLVNSFFHLLLRSNADSMAIRPSATSWRGNMKWKFFGSNELGIGNTRAVILQPDASIPELPPNPLEKDSIGELDANERNASNRADPHKSLPAPPQLAVPGIAKHSRKRSQYSVFPTEASGRQLLRPSSSIYETNGDNTLRPPRAPFARSHQRHSSNVSTATVQIGLRLSNVSIPPGMRGSNSKSQYQPLSPRGLRGPSALREEPMRLSAQSLDVPVTLRSPTSDKSSIEAKERSPQKTSVTSPKGNAARGLSAKRAIDRSATMKSLPPHPPLGSNKGKKPETDVEKGTGAASSPRNARRNDQASASGPQLSPSQNELWPLRGSQDILLPRKTYKPGENGGMGWI